MGAACQRRNAEVRREARQHNARQLIKLDEIERNHENEGIGILWRNRCLCWVRAEIVNGPIATALAPTAAWMAEFARPSGSVHYVAGERFVGKCIHDGIRFFLFQPETPRLPEKRRCPDNRVPTSRTGMLSGFRRIDLRFLQC